MKQYTLIICFAFITYAIVAQNPNMIRINSDSVKNRIHLSVVDVITRADVSDFNVTIYVGYDTIAKTVHAAKDLSLNLYPGMQYRMMIVKSGFDTLRTDWTQPADTADVYVDFYLRKTGMTKAERKEAYRQSRTTTHRTTGYEGGFQVMSAPRCYMDAWRVDIFLRDGGRFRTSEYVK